MKTNSNLSLGQTARLIKRGRGVYPLCNVKLPCSLLAMVTTAHAAMAALVVEPVTSVESWAVTEFRVSGVETVANRFDPAQLALDAEITAPSGKTFAVPGFWFQDYTTSLQNNREVLARKGAGEWRLRFTPQEQGEHTVQLSTTVSNAPGSTLQTNFTATFVPEHEHRGYVTISTNDRFFEVKGEALPLNGQCVSWHGQRGTFDYRDWFTSMKAAGENYARLWMAPWAFAIEAEPGTLLDYLLDRAWQLDEVFRIAETNGIYLMLCFDYHGMFQTEPDYWGGNNAWLTNPYNTAHGGPCPTPNSFFTSTAARELYKKRVRYLIARYGAHPNLLAWQFFNEIDNVYNLLNATDVANFHREMGDWLKENDPFDHLVTTSLTGSSDRPEIWNLSQMDFAMYHSYGLGEPARQLPPIVASMWSKYQKPIMVGELGIDFRGFGAEVDPHQRGLRQGIWAGLLSGSVGTSMSWWWEEIHARNLYSIYESIDQFLGKTDLGQGTWTPIQFATSGEPPTQVGEVIPEGTPFDLTLNLSAQWGLRTVGQLALTDSATAAGRAAAILNTFVQGTAHPELRNPFIISGWFGENAKLVMHLNSVSSGAIMNVRVDGVSIYNQPVPNKDGGWEVNNEYNQDYTIDLPPGKHRVEIRNAGADWFYLDWVRFEQVLPAYYLNNWQPSPVAVGMASPSESLVFVVNPAANYPANATATTVAPVTGATIRLDQWGGGTYHATWFSTRTGEEVGRTSSTTTNEVLTLPLPDFSEEISGRIVPEQEIDKAELKLHGHLELTLTHPAPAGARIEQSPDLRDWSVAAAVPFGTETIPIQPSASDQIMFFRLTLD